MPSSFTGGRGRRHCGPSAAQCGPEPSPVVCPPRAQRRALGVEAAGGQLGPRRPGLSSPLGSRVRGPERTVLGTRRCPRLRQHRPGRVRTRGVPIRGVPAWNVRTLGFRPRAFGPSGSGPGGAESPERQGAPAAGSEPRTAGGTAPPLRPWGALAPPGSARLASPPPPPLGRREEPEPPPPPPARPGGALDPRRLGAHASWPGPRGQRPEPVPRPRAPPSRGAPRDAPAARSAGSGSGDHAVRAAAPAGPVASGSGPPARCRAGTEGPTLTLACPNSGHHVLPISGIQKLPARGQGLPARPGGVTVESEELGPA
ncbi:translation initiation factor IF-2-like [Prionailurus bengalensis]|uniref:translation initiation factor IF-2-like n=1 Tax=Prionailurus bengalensis TaxID=37029 RepID=UPI001CA9AC00|nr:translation initiation factor IF-2-like [Prionailurus bengalensis]